MKALYALFALMPFFALPFAADQGRIPRIGLFLISVGAANLLEMAKRPLRVYWNRDLALFLGWLGILWIYRLAWPMMCSKSMVLNFSEVMAYFNFAAAVSLFWLLATRTTARDWASLNFIIQVTTLAIALVGIGQKFGLSPIELNTKIGPNPVAGFFDNPTIFGSFVALGACSMLSFEGILGIWGYLICGIAIALSNSASGLTVWFLALAVHWVIGFEFKRGMILGLSAFFAWWFLSLRDGFFSIGDRLVYWGWAKDLWLEKFWFGWGLGAYQLIGSTEGKPGFWNNGHWAAQAHNDYLQLGVEAGIIGLGLLFWFIYGILRNYFKAQKPEISRGWLSGFVGFGALAFVGFPAHLPMTAMLGVFYLAGLESVGKQNG